MDIRLPDIRVQDRRGSKGSIESNKSRHSVVEKIHSDVHADRINEFHIVRPIGAGSFGTVFLVTDGDMQYALKAVSRTKLKKVAMLETSHASRGGLRGVFRGKIHSWRGQLHEDSNPIELVRKEIAIFKKLDHPNIVKLYQVINDDENDLLYLVYDYCEKGVSLKMRLDGPTQPLEEHLAKKYFSQLFLAIEYMHAHGIAHRDIKPDNLLICADDSLKVVDLGESELFSNSSNDKSQRTAGSPAFFAPELCSSEHGQLSTFAQDVFAMGVTLYCYLHGKLPFTGHSILELYDAILHKEPELDESISPQARDIIMRLMDKNPETRITLDQIREHGWISDIELPSKIDNCTDKEIEVTSNDLKNAFQGINPVFTVIRAISKLRIKKMSSSQSLKSQQQGSSLSIPSSVTTRANESGPL